MPRNVPQTTNAAFNTACRHLCFCSSLCISCCGIWIQRQVLDVPLILIQRKGALPSLSTTVFRTSFLVPA